MIAFYAHCMVYAPTYHASEFVLRSRRRYHRELKAPEGRSGFLDENDRENAIDYQDMLHTSYNWTIVEATLEGRCFANGFSKPVFLNAAEPHEGTHHVLARKL
jgi:hypothetical protein